jgi:hypothetical protein
MISSSESIALLLKKWAVSSTHVFVALDVGGVSLQCRGFVRGIVGSSFIVTDSEPAGDLDDASCVLFIPFEGSSFTWSPDFDLSKMDHRKAEAFQNANFASCLEVRFPSGGSCLVFELNQTPLESGTH